MSSPSTLQPSMAMRLHSFGLGILTLLLFVMVSNQQSFIGFDSRFVMFAQEMLRHGPSIFPTTYGEPYADYSAMSTFFIYVLSLPFGHVTSFTAWLPSSIAAAVIVTLMYRLLAPYSPRWALVSIALMLLSVTFISEVRAVSLDLMLAAVSFAVFYLAYAADHFNAHRRLGVLFALLVLGFAIRGPIGLIVPTGMLCSYYLFSGQYRRMLGFGVVALALLCLCIGLILWLADISGDAAFVRDVIRMQVTGRIDGSEGSSNVLFYFTSSLGNYALAYPLALLTLVGVLVGDRNDRGPQWRLMMFCAAAGLIVLIGLSIPQAKKARYLLPMLPMAAIVAAYPFQAAGGRLFAGLRLLIQGLWLVLPGVLFGVVLVAHHRLPESLPSIGLILGLLVFLQIVALVSLFKPALRVAGLACCAVLAVWSVYILYVEPIQRGAYDTRQFSLAVLDRVHSDSVPLVLHGLGKDAKAIKFMVNADTDVRPIFTETSEQLEAVKAPAYIVMSEASYQKLPSSQVSPLTRVLEGRFDKDDYVLLQLAP
ncbi:MULTISPECIES: ArnT family glycosyltransferase [Pseudomonas]|uniref:Glycosyltransferase family 39 protein n=1 Tax=Pseudomonas izuensis TaxID=2684212 RepID=A0ABM7S1Y2_9PSED|nr:MULTISPECIES: glycosyltransferase family 39 protein [Pseudomonas]RKS27614.1 4-amino-4-deoxy-L-arabinose transferase-like glycosyltransferase [Pseudomonas sp. WPR_5_2]BCX68372.1 glycosyltransferase family 39 protein [Pseudomonas izuensis]